MRTLLAAIIGGLVVFVWGFVSHAQLNLAESTIKQAPKEDALHQLCKDTITQPGIYAVPYRAPAVEKDPAQKEAWEKKYQEGNALIIRGRDHEQSMSPQTLMYQGAICVIGAFILALFLGSGTSAAGAVTRIFSGAAFGAFAWVSQDAPNWIWYRFPWDYEQATLINAVVGWAAAAFVMALILKKPAPPPKKA
jgi:hypothetical protein